MVRTNFQEFIGDVHVLSNLQVGSNLFANDLAANVLTIAGNVAADYFIGDGGFLSNIATTLDDIIANPGGNSVSNTVVFVSGQDPTANTAIVTYANVGVSISNTNPTGEYQLSIGSNIFVNTHASNVLTVIGAIGSNLFIGDGGLLSNIATTLDQIVDQGNTVSNTIQFVSGSDTATSNTGIVTHKDVGISVSNVNPTGEFQFGVGANLFVNTYSSNVLTVEGNVVANTMILGSLSVTSAYGLNHVTAQGSVTSDTISLTNATTGLSASSNITAGGNVTAQTLISTANVEVGDRLKFASNVFVDDLRVADLAANLVTYDKTTGELMDSGGLFANKLAVVSVQPPSALTANATTVANHGTYTVTTSSLAANSNAWNVFDGDTAVEWLASTTSDHLYNASGNDGVYGGTSNLFAGNYIQSGASSAGEWLAIEFPYKTTLRHMKLTPPATVTSYPASANLYATNDSLTWTELTNWSAVNPVTSSNVQTVIVNASAPYKKYAMVVTKTNGSDTNTGLAKWDLFAESFSIDGGKISMAQQATTGGETVMDQSGPHGRLPKAVPLKKYPESHITFNWNTMEKFHNTTTGVGSYYIPGGGYKVSASSVYSQSSSSEGGAYGLYAPWKVFDRKGWQDPSIERYGWLSDSGKYSSSDGSVGSADTTTYNGSSTATGEWLELKLPKKIKLKSFSIVSMTHNSSDVQDRMPKTATLLGSNDGSTWSLINDVSLGIPTEGVWINVDVNATEYYKYIRFVVTSTHADGTPAFTDTGFTELEYYGYEEDLPAGDTSVDTTFTSIMNTPQTTGANVYVDGNLGETFTNRVTGPTVSNTHTTYVSAGKYWELSGNVESNVTVEANTFLSGDAPHSVSVWFNSSNLEANVSNTCVFSVSDQEKLDSVNLDLQSNTWHNLTYAYQGEGGSRVTYLDGRKVAEDQAEDTFGDYPPFAMTGFSQGGYVVSASGTSAGNPYETLNNLYSTTGGGAVEGDYTGGWICTASTYPNGLANTDAALFGPAGPGDLSGYRGEWIKVSFPHAFKLDFFTFRARNYYGPEEFRLPKDAYVWGSNDDQNWEIAGSWTNQLYPHTHTATSVAVSSTKAYKHIVLQCTKVASIYDFGIAEMQLYGHRENDLVRLPDPTNVLKYPHTRFPNGNGEAGNNQDETFHESYSKRGYVIKASGWIGSYPPYAAFNGEIGAGLGQMWVGGYNKYGDPPSNGNYKTNLTAANIRNLKADLGSGGSAIPNGEWLYIEMPNKLKVTSTRMISNPSDTGPPENFVIYGTNDVSAGWNVVDNSYATTSSGIPNNLTGKTWNVSTSGSPVAYKYFAVVVTKLNVTGTANGHATLVDWSLYGTEEATPIPIQIGGGNIDKVANFRVYDKFVGEDQALEIWDAQKDEFGRAKSSMTLHKGRLGIGTTEPEGRLAVLDEPHNLEEFPPRAMSDDKTYIEGHGEFCTNASNIYINSYAYKAFNKIQSGSGMNLHWSQHDVAGVPTYDNISGEFTGSTDPRYLTNVDGLNVNGHWIQIEFPYKINYRYSEIQGPDHAAGRQPHTGYIVGSNDLSGMWTSLHNYSGMTRTGVRDFVTYTPPTVSTQTFKYIRLVIEKMGGGNEHAGVSQWRIFGTREQGQSVLHDGQLTLTKNLTVPRIGPALDADDTPRRDRLVVEYNTSTNPTFEGAVRDTSGRGNDGAFYSGAYYDATEKALVFDGTDDSVRRETLHNFKGGNITYGVSMWIKLKRFGDADGSNVGYIYTIGNVSSAGQKTFVYVRQYNTGENPAYQLLFAGYSYDFPINKNNWELNRWYHIVVGYGGTTFKGENLQVYVDGVNVGTLTDNASSGGDAGAQLNIAENPRLTLGKNVVEHFNGYISNFKLYDTVLTAEEVKTLYDMGRCDEGHHVVNFSKTRVGIGLGDGEAPRGALDVRGDIYGGCPVFFEVYASGNTSGSQYMDFDSHVVTKGGGWTTDTTKFYAPIAGYYKFDISMMGTYLNGRGTRIEWRINGTKYPDNTAAQMYDFQSSGVNVHLRVSGNTIAYLNVGDWIGIYNSSNDINAGYGKFTGFYLSN